MHVVTNEALITRNRKIAQYLFFAGLGLLIASFFLGNSLANNNPTVGIYFQCVILPILFILVITSVRMSNTWVRPPHPWEAIPDALKGVGGDMILYNYLMPGDQVLVTQNGIFAIVTRFHNTPQKVVDDKWEQRGGIFAYMRQEQIGNPSKDAIRRAEATQGFLRTLLQDETVEVKPLVVFVSKQANVVKEGTQTVPVLYAYGDKKDTDSLKAYLRDLKKGGGGSALTPAQIAILDDALLYED